MNILREQHTERYGNECLIKASVVLLEFSDTNYMVISTEQFIGGWTDNAIADTTWSYKDKNEAVVKYNQIVGSNTYLKRGQDLV